MKYFGRLCDALGDKLEKAMSRYYVYSRKEIVGYIVMRDEVIPLFRFAMPLIRSADRFNGDSKNRYQWNEVT